MYRHPTHIKCPQLLLSNLSSPIVRYCQQARQFMIMGTSTANNKSNPTKNELIFRFWQVTSPEHGSQIREAKYQLVKKYNVVDCAYGPDGFCILWLQSKKRQSINNKQIICILRLSTKNELEYCNHFQMPPLSTAIKQDCQFNEVIKEMAYDQDRCCVELTWKYKSKTLLTWKEAENLQTGYRLLVRCQSIAITVLKNEVSFKANESFYYGIRSSYTSALVIFNHRINQQNNTESQKINCPLLLIYETLPAIPHHLSEGEMSRAINFRLCQMHPSKLIKNELQKSSNITIDNYTLGVDRQESELTENTDLEETDENFQINQLIHAILMHPQTKQVQQHKLYLTAVTTHGISLKIIKFAVDLSTLKAQVLNLKKINFVNASQTILALGTANDIIWVKVCSIQSLEYSDLYIFGTDKNLEYKLIYKLQVEGSRLRPIIHLDAESRMIVAQVNGQSWSVIEMCEKKLIYLKLIQRVLSGIQEETVKEGVTQQIIRQALELL